MATIKMVYVPRKGSMQLRLVFQAKSIQKRKDFSYFRIPLKDFDSKKQEPKRSFARYKEFITKINDLQTLIYDVLYEVQFKNITADELKTYYLDKLRKEDIKNTSVYLGEFTKILTEELRNNKRFGTADNYDVSVGAFLRYRLNQDIQIKDITYNELLGFKNYKLSNNIKSSTISEYLSKIRTICKEAQKRYEFDMKNPFQTGLIVSPSSYNRNIHLDDLKLLKTLKPKHKDSQLFLDLYLLTFYLRGHDLVDILTLKEIKRGRVVFERTKLFNRSGMQLSVKIEPEAMEIIDKYKKPNTYYLLPFITEEYRSENGREDYKKLLNKMNYRRRIIMNQYKINFEFSFKTSRHTWASLARKIGIQYDVIKASMGHKNRDITNVYLAYDDEQLDEANRKLLDLLK